MVELAKSNSLQVGYHTLLVGNSSDEEFMTNISFRGKLLFECNNYKADRENLKQSTPEEIISYLGDRINDCLISSKVIKGEDGKYLVYKKWTQLDGVFLAGDYFVTTDKKIASTSVMSIIEPSRLNELNKLN